MPTEKVVYEQHADQYERLVQCEDYQGNILREIEKIRPLEGLDVVDLGAGTGRLTRLLSPLVRTIHAFDASRHMLKTAETSLRNMGLSNWTSNVADHRQIPVKDASADLVISGWSFCYLAVWGGDTWKSELERGLVEIERILRPGGTILLLETMGTGATSPNPPEHLMGYYTWLDEKGFQSSWIRTDYKFKSIDEARELTGFFFGDAFLQKFKIRSTNVVPECTGIWWRSC